MLKQKIQADATGAMKSGENLKMETLRMLLASAVSKEKEKRYKLKLEKDVELTDDEMLDVLSSEIKKRKDAIALYIQGKRPELAEKEEKEMEILKKYLPEQLSEEEIKKLVEETINEMSARGGSALGGKDMGKVMADLNPKIKAKADAGQVSKIVKDLLNSGMGTVLGQSPKKQENL